MKFIGSGFVDDVCWDLKGAQRSKNAATSSFGFDEVYLGEVPVGTEKCATVFLENMSTQTMRFQFPETMPAPFVGLHVSPSVGHILPKGRKAITFTFKPLQRLDDTVTLPITIASISYQGDEEDWDDSMRSVTFEDGASTSADGCVETVVPEPAHKIVEGAGRESPLKVMLARRDSFLTSNQGRSHRSCSSVWMREHLCIIFVVSFF